MNSNEAPFLVIILPILAVFGGCHGSSSHHSPVLVIQPIFASELEPNEVVEDANFIGIISPGAEFIIDGFVADAGPDQIDHYAFQVGKPVEVEFFLDTFAGSGDLDVCIYDPVLDEYVFCFENDGDEHGFFSAPFVGEEFQFAVFSFSGAAEYELDVILHPYSAFLEAEALDSPGASPERRSVVRSARTDTGGRETVSTQELEPEL